MRTLSNSFSKSLCEFTHRGIKYGGDTNQDIDGDILLSAFNIADVVRMNLGQFGELLLAELPRHAVAANRFTKNTAVFECMTHSGTESGIIQSNHSIYTVFVLHPSRCTHRVADRTAERGMDYRL